MKKNPNHNNWLSVKMNIEEYREYCLSLGADVEEKPMNKDNIFWTANV